VTACDFDCQSAACPPQPVYKLDRGRENCLSKNLCLLGKLEHVGRALSAVGTDRRTRRADYQSSA
jgi:hypothetical protein